MKYTSLALSLVALSQPLFTAGVFASTLPSGALNSDDSVKVTPEGCDVTCSTNLAETEDGAIVFEPVSGSAAAGLLYYPSNAVDARLYAAVARRIASYGYMVAVMPFTEQSGDKNTRAVNVMARFPTLTKWGVAGHGDGAALATSFASSESSVLALALHGGAPGADLSSVLPEELLIYAFHTSVTASGYSDPSDFESSVAANLPSHAQRLLLPGGVHSAYSHLDAPASEPEATISREVQQNVVADATAHLLLQLVEPTYTDAEAESLVHAEPSTSASSLCSKAQIYISGLKANSINVTATMVEEERVFMTTTLAGISGPASEISVVGHDAIRGNALVRQAPPLYVAQTFCKMYSRESVVEALGSENLNPSLDCMEINSNTFQQALYQTVPWFTRTLYLNWAKTSLEFGDDVSTSVEDWIATAVNVPLISGEGFKFTSSVHISQNEYFCKLLSHESAVLFIESQAFGKGYEAFVNYKAGENGGVRNPPAEDDDVTGYIIGGVTGGVGLGAALFILNRRSKSQYGLKRRRGKGSTKTRTVQKSEQLTKATPEEADAAALEEGRSQEGDYEEGDYEEGDYEEGDYEEGDYEEGDYEEGDYEDGDYEEGDYEDGEPDEANAQNEDLEPVMETDSVKKES